ncbi:DNA-directed RNA polymerase subunit beta [Vibrio harveyi]|uniref:DNA-directed RNA polymerase subunit beta n=1 Tax=Vibrio harveyi TaxID=669 RepID=UPI0005395A04|nr:DNA-directed RNA polymerase subunit beta [Vibrio harveyi]AIV04712.1 DNA-directed RNA polymerase subunit beta [Vibrio harveyi]
MLFVAALASPHAASISQDNISQYLEEHSKRQQLEDHYAATVTDNLDLDAQTDGLTWKEDGKPEHCQYTKGEITEARDYDYGEAKDLSDGLHNIDLPPVHTPKNSHKHRTYSNNPQLLAGNKQFAAPAEGSVSFSVSSDCF